MPDVRILCPVKKVAVKTGVFMSNSKDMTFNDNHIKCSECGEVHTWSNKDVLDDPGVREQLS